MFGNCLTMIYHFRGVFLLSKVYCRSFPKTKNEKHMEDMRVNNDCVVRSKGDDFQTKLPPTKKAGGYHL